MHHYLHRLIWLYDKVNQPLSSLGADDTLHGVPPCEKVSILLYADLVPALVNNFLDVHVQVIQLLLGQVLNCHVHWVHVSDLESLRLKVVDCHVVEVYLVRVSAERDVV